jgi:alkaline phosphatase
MKKTLILVVLYCFTFIFPGYSRAEDSIVQSAGEVRNIILLIGDGMGIPHLQAAMVINRERLNIEEFNDIGLIKTHSSNSFLTDSGAAGTALATGYKTYNGAVGVDQDTIHRTSILKYASMKVSQQGS